MVMIMRLARATRLLPAAYFLLILFSVPGLTFGLDEEVPRVVQATLEAHPSLKVAGRSANVPALIMFYQTRDFQPLWVDPTGRPNAQAQALLDSMNGASSEGLEPSDYRLAPVVASLTGPTPETSLSTLVSTDIAISAILLRYATDVRLGRIPPSPIELQRNGLPRSVDAIVLLNDAARASHPQGFIAALAPTDSLYVNLRSALARYRSFAASGGWPMIPDGPKFAIGDNNARVVPLRRRLQITGDLQGAFAPRAATHFDEELKDAVIRFQLRHGLQGDGVVGPQTLTALNMTAAEAVRALLANLERARWLPDDLGNPYVIVNLADFELDVVQGGRSVLSMRVVVGERDKESPAFSDTIRYIEFNPYWNVPRSIAVKEKLPQLRRNPYALAAQNIRVLSSGEEINPASVDWNSVSANAFPFRLRQDPGPRNALGRMKFMFPNPYDVYLHDTPSRALFQRTVRAFSHGCIRVEKPLALAEFLLRDNPGWGLSRIEKTIASGRNRAVNLQQPIPVHLVYLTAWVDENGIVQFRDDLYSRDAKLVATIDTHRE